MPLGSARRDVCAMHACGPGYLSNAAQMGRRVGLLHSNIRPLLGPLTSDYPPPPPPRCGLPDVPHEPAPSSSPHRTTCHPKPEQLVHCVPAGGVGQTHPAHKPTPAAGQEHDPGGGRVDADTLTVGVCVCVCVCVCVSASPPPHRRCLATWCVSASMRSGSLRPCPTSLLRGASSSLTDRR